MQLETTVKQAANTEAHLPIAANESLWVPMGLHC